MAISVDLLNLLNQRFASDDTPVFVARHGVVEADSNGLRLTSAFQPILRATDNSVLGWEGLLRAFDEHGAPLAPEAAFDRLGVGEAMARFDRICRSLHLANFVAQQPKDAYLFLNLHPRHLQSVSGEYGRTFECIVREAGLEPGRVVLEILEHATTDEVRLSHAVSNFKTRGFLIALDDFGGDDNGVSERRLFSLRPHIVKLDRRLLDGRRARPSYLLPKLVRVVNGLGAHVVAEGIETASQRALAEEAGIPFLQGYLFGRPAPGLDGAVDALAA